jgi:hypothetical protein
VLEADEEHEHPTGEHTAGGIKQKKTKKQKKQKTKNKKRHASFFVTGEL